MKTDFWATKLCICFGHLNCGFGPLWGVGNLSNRGERWFGQLFFSNGFNTTDRFFFFYDSQGECEVLERQVDARCDALIRSIERRRQWLIDAVRQDKETKQRSLKEHVTSCTCKLQKTTSLLQFCIEALKENDPVSFLQVSPPVIYRGSLARSIINTGYTRYSPLPRTLVSVFSDNPYPRVYTTHTTCSLGNIYLYICVFFVVIYAGRVHVDS